MPEPHQHPTDSAFAALLQSSVDAIVLTDDSGVVVEFNSGAETIFGWARSEALGASIGDLIVPDRLRRAHEAGMARMRDGGAPRVLGRRVEMPALRRSGEEFPCEVALSTFTIEGKRVVAAIMRDMSELRAAIEEQRSAAAFLQSIFDDQTEVIFRFDAEMRLTYANDAALRFYEIDLQDFLGRHLFDDVEPDAAERLRAELAVLTPDDPTTRATDPKRLPSGDIRWIDWTNRALFDETGARTGYLSVGRDVTEKHESELALEQERQVNALYRRMVEAMPDSVYAKDLEGRYLTGSRKLAAICGVDDVSAVLGGRVRDFVPAGVAAAIEAEERAFYASGRETETTTVHGLAEDGEYRWFVKQRALFRDAEGQVTGLIAHIRDVTEQVLAQSALAESEARFAIFMANAPVGMYLKDPEGRYLLANPEMAHVFGRPVEDVLGLAARDLYDPELVAVIEAADEAVRLKGEPSAIEEHIPGAERYEWTLVVRFPFEAVDGSGVMVGGFDIDITPMKQAEAEAAGAREALFQSEKLNVLGAFAAGVAHEMNNPLTILAGQAAMLAEEAEGGPLAKRAEMIERVAERCGRIARSFLSVARRRPPEVVAVDLGEIVGATLEVASFTLRNTGVIVEQRVPEDLPWVAGDTDQLHHVLLNLFLNAQQAMAATETPRILALEAFVAPAGDTVHLDVRDTGPGVPPADRDRIFEPFFTTKAAGGGTGLGLSISRSALEGVGGRIDLIESASGAVFRITLQTARAG